MSRAYICLARNDLEANLLQVLDLWPNESQRNPPYQGLGQTEYLTWFPQNDAVAITAGPPIIANDTYYGLRAYLFDCVDNQSAASHIPLTVAFADDIAAALLGQVATGAALTTAIVDGLVAGICASSDLTGLTAAGSTSLGSIEELLRILAGETYRVASGAAFSTGAGVFHAAQTGVFVTTPDIIRNSLTNGDEGVLYGLPVLPKTPVVQTGTSDVNFHAIRQIVHTGILDMSAATGVLSKLKAATFTFDNPNYVYVPDTDTITCGALAAGTSDTISINGAVFTAIAGAPNPALQQFADITQGGATPTAVALSLQVAINDAASIALTGMVSTAVNVGPIVTVRQQTGNQYWFDTSAPTRVTFGAYPAMSAQAVRGSRLVSTTARAVVVYDHAGNVI